MDTVIDIGSALCLLLGSFLCISGGIGILRFPDFYTRMHAVGVSDTSAAAMVLIGLMLQGPEGLVIVKLMAILLLTLFVNPAASHALAQAAMHNGLMPVLGSKEPDDKEIGETQNKGETESSKP